MSYKDASTDSQSKIERLKANAIHIDLCSEEGLKELRAAGEEVAIQPLTEDEEAYYARTGKPRVYSTAVTNSNNDFTKHISKPAPKPNIFVRSWKRAGMKWRWWWRKTFNPRRDEYVQAKPGNFRKNHLM